jgi:hypothetical protein
MRCILFLSITVFTLGMVIVLSGCGESSTEPDPIETYSVSGTVTIDGTGDVTAATVGLYQAPQDAQVTEALTMYPSVGFSDYELMLFNPLSQEPIRTTYPDDSGTFQWGNLQAGRYIVAVSHNDYVCPTPVVINLFGNEDIGSVALKEPLEVVGDITSSTIWQSGGVYRIASDIRILQGVTLSIQDETLVLLEDDHRIQVFGNLQIDGIPSQPVIFRLDGEDYQDGDDWGGLQIEGSAGECDIFGAGFHNTSTAIEIKGSMVTVSECLFNAPESFGVYFESQTGGSVTHSILIDGYTGLTSRNSDHEFSYNVILRMANYGIEAKDSSEVVIRNNVIRDCKFAIFSDWFTAPIISHNLIRGGQRGIDATRGFEAVIEYNEFRQQSGEGIYFHIGYCYPEIFSYNNFREMPEYILFVSGSAGQQRDTVYAQLNYWDGDDAEAIPLRIRDGHDFSSIENPIGPVVFDPYLQAPEALAGP